MAIQAMDIADDYWDISETVVKNVDVEESPTKPPKYKKWLEISTEEEWVFSIGAGKLKGRKVKEACEKIPTRVKRILTYKTVSPHHKEILSKLLDLESFKETEEELKPTFAGDIEDTLREVSEDEGTYLKGMSKGLSLKPEAPHRKFH